MRTSVADRRARTAARRRARAVGVEIDGERIMAGHVVSSVPWFAFPAFAASVPALADLSASAGAMRASPIVTVNLWLDRAVTDAPFIGLPGRTFSGCSTRGALRRGLVAPVADIERRGEQRRLDQRRADRPCTPRAR
jgi:hypothetical protein